MKARRFSKNIWISATLGLCLLFFQNCSPVKTSSSQPQTGQSAPDGGPYTGLQKVYRHFDNALPCGSLDRNGDPLPNDEILIRPDNQGLIAAHLAREQCKDISPLVLAKADVSVSSSDQSIIFKNKVFTAKKTPGDFDLVAASCPAGRAPLASPSRVNALPDSLDWAASSWYAHPGINVSLYSTLESLPAYLIKRTDPLYLDYWRRDSQSIPLQVNTAYAYSFLAQAGSLNAAEWNFYRDLGGNPNDEGARISFNFLTLTATTIYSQNMTGLSATITPFGNGYLCTVYFTSSAATGGAPLTAMGVGPLANGNYGSSGDSIIATAAQLVPINQFCQ